MHGYYHSLTLPAPQINENNKKRSQQSHPSQPALRASYLPDFRCVFAWSISRFPLVVTLRISRNLSRPLVETGDPFQNNCRLKSLPSFFGRVQLQRLVGQFHCWMIFGNKAPRLPMVFWNVGLLRFFLFGLLSPAHGITPFWLSLLFLAGEETKKQTGGSGEREGWSLNRLCFCVFVSEKP